MSKAQRRKPGGGTNTIPQVTGLTASLTPENKVYIQWNPVTNATTYWVYRDQYVPGIITNTSFTDGYLTSGQHIYAVAAVVNGQLGPKSNSVTITVN